MEPKLPSSDRAPEFRTAPSAPSGEALPQSSGYEITPAASPELRERHNEATSSTGTTDNSIITLPAPTLPVSDDDDQVTLPQVKDDLPATANDGEQIEKEWVDKAKKIIAETKDDPYRREQEVNKLQADYLFKRYGRKLDSPQ